MFIDLYSPDFIAWSFTGDTLYLAIPSFPLHGVRLFFFVDLPKASPKLIIIIFLNYNYPSRCEVLSHMILICIFLKITEIIIFIEIIISYDIHLYIFFE